MYPNYEKKSTKYKHIDLIKQMTGLYYYDYREYKKILSIDYTLVSQNIVKRLSFIQPIKSVKKILNFNDINSE